MEKTQKNKLSFGIKKFVKTFMLIVTAFVSVFFVACGKSSSASDSGYDAYGHYRLLTPALTFYDKTSDNKTNEYTGSFLVPMEFYRDNTFSTMFNNSLNPYFDHDYDQGGSKAFPMLNGEFEYVSNGSTLDGLNVYYPDYTFWVDGYIYQIHVHVDYSKLVINSKADTANGSYYNSNNYIKPVDVNGSPLQLNNIFKFSYRNGTSGEWLDADEFIQAVYLHSNQETGEIGRAHV